MKSFLNLIFCLKNKKVLFAVRTNISYEPSASHRPPVPIDLVVSFDVKDFLHIKEVLLN